MSESICKDVKEMQDAKKQSLSVAEFKTLVHDFGESSRNVLSEMAQDFAHKNSGDFKAEADELEKRILAAYTQATTTPVSVPNVTEFEKRLLDLLCRHAAPEPKP